MPDRRRRRQRRIARLLIGGLVALAVVAFGVTRVLDDDDGDGGRTYSVAPNGDDGGPGTVERPFRTLSHALEVLRPGDTLLVRGGAYREQVNPRITPGLPDRGIVVAAYPGERPVVEGLLWLRSPDHWRIRGINVTWSDENTEDQHMVKFTGGTGWEFSDAEVWGARSYAAILVTGSPRDFRLARLYVHDTASVHGPNEDHLLYLNAGDGGGVIERCVLVGSPNGRAIKIGGGDESSPPVGNLVIRYNTMVDNRGPSNVQLSYGAFGNRIERNILVSPAEGRANVTAFRLTGTGNVVADNLWWDSRGPVEEGEPGLVDGGGNVRMDPRFVDPEAGDLRPTAPEAAAYGRHAP